MRAYSDDIAWRVITRIFWFGQPVSQVCDARNGLDVSRHYVESVMHRFRTTGDVATHQGKGADPLARMALTRPEDCQLIQQLVASPRVTLKEHLAQFVLDSGVRISYRRGGVVLVFTEHSPVSVFASMNAVLCDDKAPSWRPHKCMHPTSYFL